MPPPDKPAAEQLPLPYVAEPGRRASVPVERKPAERELAAPHPVDGRAVA